MTNGEQPQKLRYEQVCDRLGEALFAEEWRAVAKLTERVRWLVETRGGTHRDKSASIVPASVTYVTSGAPYFAGTPDREYREACKKYEFRKHLCEQFDVWLDHHGVDGYEDDDGLWVDRLQFDRAYAKAFPSAADIDDDEVIGWMEAEIKQRWAIRTRPRMPDIVIAARTEFPALAERRARDCYTRVSPNLKRRGPLPKS